MVEYVFLPHFERTIKKLDSQLKLRVKKQIKKILTNPLVGKPMRASRYGTREVYIDSFILAYKIEVDCIVFTEFYHKDEQ